MTKKTLKTIKETTEELLEKLGVKTEVEVNEDKENDLALVQIESENPALLIGYHGETISALQLVLGLLVYKKTSDWQRVSVNVGDYRERRRESLEGLAKSALQRVKFAGEPYALPPLPPAERRIIHLILADNTEVTTESEGEGRERRVIVKPKSSRTRPKSS